jgi:hypothetical protein
LRQLHPTANIFTITTQQWPSHPEEAVAAATVVDVVADEEDSVVTVVAEAVAEVRNARKRPSTVEKSANC